MHLIPEKISASKSKLNDAEVLLTLYQLSISRTISRKNISDRTGLTERCVRNALELLKEQNMIAVDNWGVRITNYGRDLLDRIGMEAADIDLSQCIHEEHMQCLVVRRAAVKVDDGREQRKAAQEKGCSTCMIWTLSDDRLIMVPGWNTDLNNPDLAAMIRMGAKLSDGDVLIATGGNDPLAVREGAAAAVLSLL